MLWPLIDNLRGYEQSKFQCLLWYVCDYFIFNCFTINVCIFAKKLSREKDFISKYAIHPSLLAILNTSIVHQLQDLRRNQNQEVYLNLNLVLFVLNAIRMSTKKQHAQSLRERERTSLKKI